jgi:hypothetical protein
MKYDYSAWFLKHKGLKPEQKYSGINIKFVPDYLPENRPKFISDKLLGSKQLTQR